MVPYAEAGPEYGMMLPTLISVSLAPGSYFFCAVAGAAITHSATDAISARMAFRMASSVARPRSAAVSGQASGNQTPKPRRPHRHHEDDQQQNHPVDRAGEALREMLGDVRHEQHEEAADDRPGDRRDAAHDEADEQRDREREGETVGRHERDRNGAERAGDAGIECAHPEGQRLVEGYVDAHRARRHRLIADRE